MKLSALAKDRLRFGVGWNAANTEETVSEESGGARRQKEEVLGIRRNPEKDGRRSVASTPFVLPQSFGLVVP